MRKQIQALLYQAQDQGYQAFQAKLIPSLDPKRIIGVRLPQLRAIAKQMSPALRARFLDALPHAFYEEAALHALLLAEEKDFSKALRSTERFLPHIDNWAICDLYRPKAFDKALLPLRPAIERWLAAPHSYTCRFGIVCLLRLYLDDAFQAEDLRRLSQIKREDFYVQMAIAWYLATALAKQEAATLPLIEERIFSPAIHRMAIQKAVESRRIRPALKNHLKSLRATAQRKKRSL